MGATTPPKDYRIGGCRASTATHDELRSSHDGLTRRSAAGPATGERARPRTTASAVSARRGAPQVPRRPRWKEYGRRRPRDGSSAALAMMSSSTSRPWRRRGLALRGEARRQILRRRGRIAGAAYGGRCGRRRGAPLLLPRVLTRLRERCGLGWGLLPADPMPDLGSSTAASRDLVDDAADTDDRAVEFDGEK